MASPQKENGYTSISNELFEKIYQSDFTLRELKIIFAVIRFTYGFNRKTAELSIRFLAEAANIDYRHVQTILKSLISKNVLIVKNNFQGIHSRDIQLNKNYESWNLSLDQKGVTKTSTSIDQIGVSSDTKSAMTSIDQIGVKERKKKTLNKTIAVLPVIPEDLINIPGFSDSWLDWLNHRKEIKKPLTPTAAKRLFNKLIKFKDKGLDLIELIDTAINKRWQDIWEPHQNYKHSNNLQTSNENRTWRITNESEI